MITTLAVRYEFDRQLLYSAIKDDKSETVDAIFKRHPSLINTSGWTGISPLVCACQNGSKASYQTLLKHGADPNKLGPFGRNLMMIAPANIDPFWVRTALAYGADPNLDNHASPNRRSIPLFAAARNEYIESARVLIEEYNADVNYQIGSQDPLVFATNSNQFEIVLLLLNNGANYRRKIGQYTSFAGSIKEKDPSVYRMKEYQVSFQAVIDWLKEQGVEYDKPKRDGDAWVY